MPKSSTVSAAEANRSFSKIFRRAAAGETITITDRGKPVAVLSPSETSVADTKRKAREEAVAALMDHLRQQQPMKLGKFQRDWAYGDD
jgi:prevent-host-death family protein